MRPARFCWSGRLAGAAMAACAVAVLLPGCAAPRAPAAIAANAVTLAGRLSLVSGTADAQKALYGGFRLVLQGSSGRFEVFSPLGQMLARASWGGGLAVLDDGRQQQQYPSFEDMTEAALGVALPQAALDDWIRGRPAAGIPAQSLPDGGFDQLGWEVRPTCSPRRAPDRRAAGGTAHGRRLGKRRCRQRRRCRIGSSGALTDACTVRSAGAGQDQLVPARHRATGRRLSHAGDGIPVHRLV
jgi:outer membrane lipoprotein LolB